MLVRSKFLGMTLCAFCVFYAMAASADDLTIRTDKGKVHGKKSDDGQVRIFLGIPYGAPPVGPLRWKPPQPAAKWGEGREATEFGSRCMQPNIYPDMHFRDPGPSEDCLNLNVWTGAKDKNQKLPVMVWIYGGGFTAGATSEPRQDGQYLAHKGVVVVSMNYRLGFFGFFVHPDLAAESSQHAAGNYGLMDQTAALRWVKKNIKAFGGDPNNVTIFGESAGSFSVSAQMASPLAQGLFERAIGESGAAFDSHGLSFSPVAEREKTDPAWAMATFGTSDLKALRALSAGEIMDKLAAAAAARTPGSPHTRAGDAPDVDGYFLPESVPQIFRENRQARVPLLAGWNRDEPSALAVNTPVAPTVQSFQELAQKDFGERAAEFLKVYPAATDADAVRSAIDYNGAKFLTLATWEWLETQVADGGTAWRYRFERPAPADKYHPAGSGSFHSDEIEYVFGTLDSRPEAVWQPEDHKLSDLMQTYWTNFARSGDPNGGDAPKWPQYKGDGGWQVMHLDAESQAGPDDHRDQWLFLQGEWGKRAQPVANSQ
jgi:para-nitrobenzyl esterase